LRVRLSSIPCARRNGRASASLTARGGGLPIGVIVGPDIIEYTLAKGPHAGRHATQHFYYQRVAPGVETTVWYEESGALVHITWYLETQTTHRFAALPAWLAEDMTVYRGDNQDPAFIEKIRKLISQRQDWPRHILNDDGYFEVI